MATDSREQREAADSAARHRQRAGELYARHRSEGKDELLAEARQESARAAYFEEKAGNATGGKDDFQRDGEAAGQSDRRTWFKQGSVADRDTVQQFQEARDGGSLMGQLVDYASRSVIDKESRHFEGARAVGKVASAPFRAARAFGRATKDGRNRTDGSSPAFEDGRSPKTATREKPARTRSMTENHERPAQSKGRSGQEPER